jgi:hypothetical protein
MDDGLEITCKAALDAIRRGEPGAMAKAIGARGSASRETAVRILAEVAAVRWRGD